MNNILIILMKLSTTKSWSSQYNSFDIILLTIFLSLMMQLGKGCLLGCSLGKFINILSTSKWSRSFDLSLSCGSKVSFSNYIFSLPKTDESLVLYAFSKYSSQESRSPSMSGIDLGSIFCERMKDAGTACFNPTRRLLESSLLIPCIVFICCYKYNMVEINMYVCSAHVNISAHTGMRCPYVYMGCPYVYGKTFAPYKYCICMFYFFTGFWILLL